MPELYRCENCDFEAERETLPDAKDLLMRLDVGGIYTDKECPPCGSLAYLVKLDEKPAAPPKVLIWMEGGLIHGIGATQEIDVVILDHDDGGGDEENLKPIKVFREDEETEYYVCDYGIIEPSLEEVEHYFKEARKVKPEEEEKEYRFVVKETTEREISIKAATKAEAEEAARKKVWSESAQATSDIRLESA